MNKQNCRTWGSQRPKNFYKPLQSSSSVIVSCAISRNEAITPKLSEDCTVTGDSYERMLRYFRFPRLANCPSDMNFQQDGAL